MNKEAFARNYIERLQQLPNKDLKNIQRRGSSLYSEESQRVAEEARLRASHELDGFKGLLAIFAGTRFLHDEKIIELEKRYLTWLAHSALMLSNYAKHVNRSDPTFPIPWHLDNDQRYALYDELIDRYKDEVGKKTASAKFSINHFKAVRVFQGM